MSADWTEADAMVAYPEGREPFYGPSDYSPIVKSLGEVIVEVRDEDWQGDTRALLADGVRFGVMLFGWGSCSGCDALQGCSVYADIVELRNRLARDVVWHESASECLAYMRGKDWQLDRCWHREESERFVREACEALVARGAS